jgi:hypothetical protein
MIRLKMIKNILLSSKIKKEIKEVRSIKVIKRKIRKNGF